MATYATSTFRDALAHIRRETDHQRRPIIKALRSGTLNACIYLGRDATQPILVPRGYFAEKGGEDFHIGDDPSTRSVTLRLSEILGDLGKSLEGVRDWVRTQNASDANPPPPSDGNDLPQEADSVTLLGIDHPFREFRLLFRNSDDENLTGATAVSEAAIADLTALLIRKSHSVFRLHLFDEEVDKYVFEAIGFERKKPGPVTVDLNEEYWLTLFAKLQLEVVNIPKQEAIIEGMLAWCRGNDKNNLPKNAEEMTKVRRNAIQTQMTPIWGLLKLYSPSK